MSITRFVTFYSYKGGVGRTLALGNVAWEAARNGKKVLIIDFDLEAPGISSIIPFQETIKKHISDENKKGGLFEFILDFQKTQKVPSLSAHYTTEPIIGDDFQEGGSIYIIPAGKEDVSYQETLQAFNWEKFYAEENGNYLFNILRSEIISGFDNPDFVLIDSRTGLTDIGGICTILLPDKVVIFTGLNDQHINGCRQIIDSIEKHSEYRKKEQYIGPIETILVASHVPDADEYDLVRARKKKAVELFNRELDVIFPYVPILSLEERLLFKEQGDDKQSVTLIERYKLLYDLIATKEDRSFKDYLQYALNEHRHLSTQGFETTLRVPIELEKVFINMHAHIHVHEHEFTLKGRDRMESSIREERLTSLDIKAAFEVADRRNVKDMVILGDPGSGKTTLLKYILVLLIEGRAPEKLGIKDHVIPLLAPLRELENPDKESFIEFIRRVCSLDEFAISNDSLNGILDNGRGIILLDGLDEVADEASRIKTCQWIDRARKRFAHTTFVITSRYAGYLGPSRLEGNVLELSIRDFTMNEVSEFLVRWFETVEVALHPLGDENMWKKKGRDDAAVLVKRIEGSEHLMKLAVNPLLLQIIALVHRDRGTLPQRRVELYDECTNVLLEKWDMAKGLDVLLSAREARQILQPLALWLHEEDERRSAPLEDIKKVIEDPLDEIGKSDINPESLLLNIRDRSGIFMSYSEKEYGFTHLSFQEYLSAEEIRNRRLFNILLSNYNKRWWKEVILLCLALDNPSMIEEFMERIIPNEHFISEISLLIDALEDSIRKPSRPLIDALNNKSLVPQARYNVIRVLKEIGGDKVIEVLKEAVNNEDKKLALTAYEALESLGVAEGIKKPMVEGIPEVFITPVDSSEMVLIPAGTFLYGGREDDEQAYSDEKPQRVIDLPAFYMDTFPVTNEQFCRFLNDRIPGERDLKRWIKLEGSYNKERCRIKKKGGSYGIEKGYEVHPVIYVNWHGASEYAKWADKRLPSEQEWEKAARGADGRIYPWGEKFDKNLCNSSEGGIGGITEVNRFSKGKSPYGCYEMAGNVWEWTSSFYDDDKDTYVLRGGSWDSVASKCRCAYRIRYLPLLRYLNVGFRCARTVTL